MKVAMVSRIVTVTRTETKLMGIMIPATTYTGTDNPDGNNNKIKDNCNSTSSHTAILMVAIVITCVITRILTVVVIVEKH